MKNIVVMSNPTNTPPQPARIANPALLYFAMTTPHPIANTIEPIKKIHEVPGAISSLGKAKTVGTMVKSNQEKPAKNTPEATRKMTQLTNLPPKIDMNTPRTIKIAPQSQYELWNSLLNAFSSYSGQPCLD